MKLSMFDLNQVMALHFLLEEASVGRAAAHLGITPAAASNALRRLRDVLHDPLLVKNGRGLVRTRMGEDLRAPAREVVAAAERLFDMARPFSPAAYRGPLPIALSEHVATLLLPALDAQVRRRAPDAALTISPVPEATAAWLERTGGVLVSPTGRFASPLESNVIVVEPFYADHYVCVMRKDHPARSRRWTAATYAALSHVLVTPRGASCRSDIDEQLEALGLSRHVVRSVPSFTLALPIVAGSDFITTMPERCARGLAPGGIMLRPVPLTLRPVTMRLLTHSAHAADGRVGFIKQLLRDAFEASARPSRSTRRAVR